MEWLAKHVEIIVTALVSLIGGGITGATFILRMRSDLEKIQLTTNRIEEDVIELKKFKDDFLVAKTKIEEFEDDVLEVKEFIKEGKIELTLEFTKTINNLAEMMRDYIKRNDEEVRRLREKYHEISNEILTTLLSIQRDIKR